MQVFYNCAVFVSSRKRVQYFYRLAGDYNCRKQRNPWGILWMITCSDFCRCFVWFAFEKKKRSGPNSACLQGTCYFCYTYWKQLLVLKSKLNPLMCNSSFFFFSWMYTTVELLHLKKQMQALFIERKPSSGLLVALEVPPRGSLMRSTGFVIIRMTQ